MKLISYLTTVSIVIVIIFSNHLLLVFNNSNYQYLLEKNNIYDNFQKEPNIDKRVSEIVDYFRGNNNLEDNFFSTQAKIHLKDVKSLFNISKVITITSVIYLILAAIYFTKKKKTKVFLLQTQIGAVITLCIFFALAVTSFLNFDFLFIKFHQLLFRNNYWLFDPQDNLVKLFTEKFFISFAIQLFINVALTCFALLLFANVSKIKK